MWKKKKWKAYNGILLDGKERVKAKGGGLKTAVKEGEDKDGRMQ